jgi:hypothetical protein
MIVRLPPLEEVVRRWGEIEKLVKRATDRSHGCYEPVDVLALLFANRAAMLFIESEDEAPRLLVVAVTEVRDYPRRRVIDTAFIGGAPGSDTDVALWAPLLVERLEEMARAIGATLLTGAGRIGWARVGGFKIAGGFMTRKVAAHE